MTRPAEQVPVPTNGKGPGTVRGHVPEPPPAQTASSGRATVDVTPALLAMGFGIVASVVLLVARSLRRRSRSGR